MKTLAIHQTSSEYIPEYQCGMLTAAKGDEWASPLSCRCPGHNEALTTLSLRPPLPINSTQLISAFGFSTV